MNSLYPLIFYYKQQSVFEKKEVVEENEKVCYSKLYNNKNYHCDNFYKPIAKI